MKKPFFIFFCLCFCACGRQENAGSEERSAGFAKMRSFTFVNSDSVKFYHDKLQKISDPDITLTKARLKYGDAVYNVTTGMHSRALTDFKEAFVLFKHEKDDSLAAYCILGQANCYKLMGESDDAIMNYLNALSIFEKGNNERYINVCYANLAETYEEKGDTANARKYLSQAISREKYGSKTYISILHLQANFFGMTNKLDSALLTDKEGIYLAEKNNYPELLSSFYDNIARCYTDKKMYDSAGHYLRKCIAVDSMNGRIQLMADTYAQLVNVYAAQKDERSMNGVANYALKLCDSTQYLRGKYEVYEGLDYYYSSAKKWDQAAPMKDSLKGIYSRLVNEETETKIAGYNVEYETSKKEQLITKQKNDLQKITYISVLLGLIALLLIITVIAVYKNYRTRKSAEISKAIQQQKDINAQTVFDTEQAERIRIARDLHDSIGQKLSVMKMYVTGEPGNYAKMPLLLDETIQEVRNISHNLMPEELNFGLLKAINTDIEKLRESGKFAVSANISAGDYQLIPLPAALNILMVFRELITNLVKHSKAKSIDIALSAADNIFNMELKDDGIGVSQKDAGETDGIGRKNIFARINMLKGMINIADNEPQGNIVTIKIPYA